MANIRVNTSLVTEAPANGANPVLETPAPAPRQIPLAVMPAVAITDTVAPNVPVAYAPVIGVATKATDYHTDFYNRIRYLPAAIDLGALVSGQSRDLFVWNQHPDARVLDALGLIDGDGIVVTGPTNFTLAENGFQKYTITVSAQGPAVVAATLSFDWQAPTLDGVVPIAGTRVVPFPFEYGNGAKETLTWSTKVITSNNGSEQRLRIRTSPRQGFSVTAFIPFHLHALAENLLYGWRDNFWGVPVFSECRKLTAPTVIGVALVEASTSFAQFVEGSTAIVYSSATDYEIIQILAISSSNITTVSPMTKVFNINAVVMPLLSCRMLSDPRRQTTGFGSFITVDFEAILNSSLPSVASAEQFLGSDMFLDEQLTIDNGVKELYTSRVDALDYVASNVATFAPWTTVKKSRTFGQQLTTQEELWNFRTWLHRRAGKLVPFWAPTHEVNFKFLDSGIVNTTLTAKDEGQATFGLLRTHILIITKTEKLPATITQISTDGTTVTLVLDIDLNRDASELLHGEYLGLHRLASDRIELVHGSNFDSTVSVPIIEVSP